MFLIHGNEIFKIFKRFFIVRQQRGKRVFVAFFVRLARKIPEIVFHRKHARKRRVAFKHIPVIFAALRSGFQFLRKLFVCLAFFARAKHPAIECSEKIIGIQHHFHAERKPFFLPFCQIFVHKIAQHKVVPLFAEQFRKSLFRVLFVKIPLCTFRRIYKRRQHRVRRTFAAVIPPHRKQNIIHIVLSRRRYKRLRLTNGFSVVRFEPAPLPCAAGNPHVALEIKVVLHHTVYKIRILVVIIPVHELQIFGHFFHYPSGNFLLVIVLAFSRDTEKHIAPHHRLKAVFFGNLRYPRKMPQQHVETVARAVQFVITAPADHMRLVHADMNIARSKTFRARGDHLFDQRVSPLVVHKQNIVCVVDVLIFRVAENLIQVRQRLNTRHQFHAVFLCKRVNLFQFRFRILPPAIPELRLALDFVGIFRIQLQTIIPRFFQRKDKIFEFRYAHHRVSRTIEHHAQVPFFHSFFLLVFPHVFARVFQVLLYINPSNFATKIVRVYNKIFHSFKFYISRRAALFRVFFHDFLHLVKMRQHIFRESKLTPCPHKIMRFVIDGKILVAVQIIG